jgi:hypothetical protein
VLINIKQDQRNERKKAKGDNKLQKRLPRLVLIALQYLLE